MKLFKVFVIFFGTLNVVKCEVFSSTDGLVNLLQNGKDLVKNLNDLVENLEIEIVALKSKITSINSELSVMEKNPQNYVANPLNAFILIKILSHDVETIQESLNGNLQTFNNSIQNMKLPRDDFEGAVEGFVRLQKVYELKSEDLSNGFIDGIKIREKLSALEIFILANEITKIDRKIAEEYFKIAIKKSSGKLRSKILEKIFQNYLEMEKFSKAIEILDEIIEVEAKNDSWQSLRDELKKFEDIPDKNITNELSGSHYTWVKYEKIFSQACMGKRVKNSTESSKLYCKFHSTNDFTKIAPFKLEIMNLVPFVGVFHDVLSNHEIDTLKNLTNNQLTRAKVESANGTKYSSKSRIAKRKTIFDESHKIIKILNSRVNDMSGLNMATAEALQVQNYGIGGHYNLHHDYAKRNDITIKDEGNRVASTLFYMSNVIKGGATVFPLLKLYVPPKKGSAVFWFNLSTSGHLEQLTFHGGCPVLIGSKWVANKWLHEFGQEFLRPCDLHPMLTEEENWENLYFTV